MSVVLISKPDPVLVRSTAVLSKATHRSNDPGSGNMAVSAVTLWIAQLFDPHNNFPYEAPFS